MLLELRVWGFWRVQLNIMKWNLRKSLFHCHCYHQGNFAAAIRFRQFSGIVLTAAFGFAPLLAILKVSRADENGIGFWISGFFGSLAAAAGLVAGIIAVAETAILSCSRAISVGQFNPALNARLGANVNARADPEWSRRVTCLKRRLSGMLAGIPFTRSFALEQTTLTLAFGDLVPQFALRWNDRKRQGGSTSLLL